MKGAPISQDDILDVMQLTETITEYICDLLQDTEKNIAVSALMSACANYILGQCKTLNEATYRRNIFVEFLDDSIRDMGIKKEE